METHQEIQLCDKPEAVGFSLRKPTEARTDRDKDPRQAKVSEKKRLSRDSGDTTHKASCLRASWFLITASLYLIVSLFFLDNKPSCL